MASLDGLSPYDAGEYVVAQASSLSVPSLPEFDAAAAVLSSPRYLVLRDLQEAVGPPIPPIAKGDERDTVRPENPGCMQLFSYYMPSLVGGGYTIKVSQEVDFKANPQNPNDNLPLHKVLNVNQNSQPCLYQHFEVISPQYKINLADVHSTYPPQGHADQPSVLPHIVFNDPHLPWETLAEPAPKDDKTGDVSTPRLPWLALFPFDCNGPAAELRLTPAQLQTLNQIIPVPADNPNRGPVKQSATFSVSMSLQQYRSLPSLSKDQTTKIRMPIVDDVQEDLDTPVDVIFMSRLLFQQLFSMPLDTVGALDTKPDLTSFKYCAHVRNVNTSGMTNAGLQDNGLFSIVHSKRTGPTNIAQNTAPRSQAVHLLSLQGVDRLTVKDGLNSVENVDKNDLVAFVSLFAWTYLCQPPLTVNFVDSMRHIGDDLHDAKYSPYLGCPKPILDGLKGAVAETEKQPVIGPTLIKSTRAKRKMIARLSNGYSMVRHRAASGEETAALNRGALLPVMSQVPTANWPYSSNTGQDYQILDQELGIMDISYSAAWQLGKTMAISDLAFVASLLRVRADAYKNGAVASRSHIATHINGFKSQAAVLTSIRASMTKVRDLSTPSAESPPPPIADKQGRWNMNTLERGMLLGPKNDSTLLTSARAVFVSAVNTGLTVSGSTAGTAGSKPYDEINPPEDVDWAFIQSWLLDRMYLYNIPSHYLVPEAGFLPPESMRFFHIDQTWVECLIDGALSVANHMDRQDDFVRDGIKKCMNKYFNTPFGADDSLHYPQVPKYGFFLRSAVVDLFPDLVVEVPYPETADEKAARLKSDEYGMDTSQPDGTAGNQPVVGGVQSNPKSIVQNGRTPILVQKHMGKGILMVLLDRVPDDGEIAYIQLTQPAHQQRFSAGDFLDDTKMEFEFRNPIFGPGFLHTTGDPQIFAKQSWDANSPFDWRSHCLNMPNMEKVLHSANIVAGNVILTSAMAGLELNDTMKFLQLMPPNSAKPVTKSMQVPYTLRVRPDSPASGLTTRAKKVDQPSTTATSPTLSAPQNLLAMSATASSLNSGSHSAATTPDRDPSHITLDHDTSLLHAVPAFVRALGASVKDLAIKAGLAPGQRLAQSYECVIYPSTSTFPGPIPSNNKDTRSFVHVDTPYSPDLIFSLTRRLNHLDEKGRPDDVLRTIEFYIPLGESQRRDRISNIAGIDGLGLVKASPCGTNCRMISNQRWVVHIDAVNKGQYVLLRVVPRSLLRSSPVGKNKELTFRLNEVILDGGDGSWMKEGPVSIKKREVYGYLINPGVPGDQEKWQDLGEHIQVITLTRRKGYVESPDGWD